MKAPLRYNWFASQVETIINKIFSLNKHKYTSTQQREQQGDACSTKWRLGVAAKENWIWFMINSPWFMPFERTFFHGVQGLSRSASSASASAPASVRRLETGSQRRMRSDDRWWSTSSRKNRNWHYSIFHFAKILLGLAQCLHKPQPLVFNFLPIRFTSSSVHTHTHIHVGTYMNCQRHELKMCCLLLCAPYSPFAKNVCWFVFFVFFGLSLCLFIYRHMRKIWKTFSFHIFTC